MKKYDFTGKTIIKYGKQLKQIKRLEDGIVGGYIESERNLSHDGDAWVFDNAKVFGDAKVSGNAEVSGNAKVFGNAWVSNNAEVFDNAEVFGDAICTKLAQTIVTYKNNITLVDNHIIIGYQVHTIKHWSENIDKISRDSGYTAQEIKAVKYMIKGLLLMRKNKS